MDNCALHNSDFQISGFSYLGFSDFRIFRFPDFRISDFQIFGFSQLGFSNFRIFTTRIFKFSDFHNSDFQILGFSYLIFSDFRMIPTRFRKNALGIGGWISIPEEQMCCRLYRSNVLRCSLLTVDAVVFDKVVHLLNFEI